MFINSWFRWDLYIEVVLHHCSWNRVDIVKIKSTDFLLSFPVGALRENPQNLCGAVYFVLRNWVGVGVFADLLTRFRRDSEIKTAGKSLIKKSRFKANQIARAHKVSSVCGFGIFTRADLSRIAQEKSYDHQSIIYKQNMTLFSSQLVVFIPCQGSLVQPLADLPSCWRSRAIR